jgi:hypothetical protein
MSVEMAVETVDLSKLYNPGRNKKQVLFHEAPETYKLYGGAMGGGKTAALINEGNELNIQFPGNFGLLMRKTWPSFRDTVMPQLEKFLDQGLVANWNRSEKLITYINGSKTRYGGIGDKPGDWEKFMSGEYGWIALDQAEQFTLKEFQMLATRLRLRIPEIEYYFLLSCNPNVGWIKELFIENNIDDYVFIPALPEDNQENLPSGYIERMEKVLTPNQRKALLEGNWDAVEEPDNIYGYAEIQKAMKRKAKVDLPVDIGADIARSGDDETVIVLREGLRIRIHSQAQGHDTMRTTGEIWRCCQNRIIPKWKDTLDLITIKVDADGVGGGVVDRLKEQRKEKEELYTAMILKMVDKNRREELRKKEYRLRMKIVEIHGSGKPKDPVHFKNLRAEIHWGLRELLEDLDLPDDRELSAQLMALKHKTNSAGQIVIIPKEEIKEKLGRSPDLAEAVIYSLADIRPFKEPRIW